MNFEDVIYGRRSVRKFLDKKVEREILEKIIDAGLWAPSAVDLQPWYYVVIESEEKRSQLLDLMNQVAEGNRAHLNERFGERHPEVVESTINFLRSLGNAPSIILCFAGADEYPLMHDGVISSVAASMENMVLTAYNYGVSSCWMTSPNQAHMEAVLRDSFAPGKGKLVGMIVLGYAPEGYVAKAPRRKSDRFEIV